MIASLLMGSIPQVLLTQSLISLRLKPLKYQNA
nr:MAG TPA: hypothetical protein [Caudoviricetes sp.]